MSTCTVLIALGCGMLLNCLPVGAQCPDRAFQYTFCDGKGGFVQKCSADPHNEPGLVPMRMGGKPGFVVTGVYQAPLHVTGYPGPQVIEVFNPQQAIVDVNEAWNEWMELVPNVQSEPASSSYCSLRICMSQNPFDFDNPFTDVTSAIYFSADNNTCIKHCDAPIVYMNFTDEFLYQGRDPYTEPMAVVYYTGKRSPKSEYSALSCEEVYSFRQHIQHVMGIFLGLRPRGEGSSCYDEQTVMGQPLNQGDAISLTEDDKCQFLKLYRPLPTGTESAKTVASASRGALGGHTTDALITISHAASVDAGLSSDVPTRDMSMNDSGIASQSDTREQGARPYDTLSVNGDVHNGMLQRSIGN